MEKQGTDIPSVDTPGICGREEMQEGSFFMTISDYFFCRDTHPRVYFDFLAFSFQI